MKNDHLPLAVDGGQIDHPLARAAPTNNRPNYERLETSYSPRCLMTNATAVCVHEITASAEGPRSTASQPVCKCLLPCPRDHCLITKQHKHKARRAQILLASEAFESVSVRDASAYASSHIGSKLLLIIASVSGHTTHTCPLSKKLTGQAPEQVPNTQRLHAYFFVTAMKAATNLFFLRSAMIPMLPNLYYMLACYNHLLHHTQKRTTILVTASNSSLPSA